MRQQMKEVALAIRADPSRAELHAAIGNGLIRETRYLEAIEAYRAAITCNPNFAEAQLALAELLSIAQDPLWREHLRAALSLQRTYEDPEPQNARINLTLLLRDAPYSVNAPIELIIDRTKVAIRKWYIECNAPARNGDAILFCAFNYSREALPAISTAEAIAHDTSRPVLNSPDRLGALARERLQETLAPIGGVVVPNVRAVCPEEIRIGGKTLVRPLDTHAGSGLALLEDQRELQAHLERHPSDCYHVSDFVDYVSSDGYYRKYRIVFVDGVPYPYHLGISPRWMVHYRNAPMAQNAWMRDEEKAFLADPKRVFAQWDATMRLVAETIGMEYFGIDCAVLRGGATLIFEADPAMLVHDEEPEGIFAYKRAAVAKIREAITRLFSSKESEDVVDSEKLRR